MHTLHIQHREALRPRPSSVCVLVVLFIAFFTSETTCAQGADEVSTALSSPTVKPEGTAQEQSTSDSSAETPWYDRIRFSGDFRSRYEGFYQANSETRNRGRFRLRLRVDTGINDDARFQLQVASGDSGTPVSTNQSFTSFFRPKPFNLDRAYLAYNPQAASALTLGAGKFGFPQNRTQMVFDDDLNVEGAWEQVSWDFADGVGINLVALQTAVTEVKRDDDAFMLAGYGELVVEGSRADFSVSAANYAWVNPNLIAVGQTDRVISSARTNEVIRNAVGSVVGFASGFNVIDVIAEATFQTARSDYPVRILVDFAHNTRAFSDRNSGFWLEAGYGRPRAVHTWGATYTYGWIEQDVAPSAYVFSDMPGTNLRLHMIEASYIPKERLSFDVTLHLTKRLVVPNDTPNDLLARLHVAIVARF